MAARAPAFSTLIHLQKPSEGKGGASPGAQNQSPTRAVGQPPPHSRDPEGWAEKGGRVTAQPAGGGGAGGARSTRCCSLSWGEARGPGGARGDEGCDRVTAEPPPQAPLFLLHTKCVLLCFYSATSLDDQNNLSHQDGDSFPCLLIFWHKKPQRLGRMCGLKFNRAHVLSPVEARRINPESEVVAQEAHVFPTVSPQE